MLYERFGVDMQALAFEADPNTYWSLPIMEFPIRNYAEFVVSQAFLDRAGRFTTWDIELHCSFAPYRRTLKKVNFEEAFHFRHGALWTKYYFEQNEETRKLVQDAVNWIFPWGYHWYGRPAIPVGTDKDGVGAIGNGGNSLTANWSWTRSLNCGS